MTIRIHCPLCRHEITCGDAAEGTTQRCDVCDADILVPAMVRYNCSSCGHRYASGPQHVGRQFACRTCGTSVLVPRVSEAGHHKGGADSSTGDNWFVGGPPAAGTPRLGPEDAERAVAGTSGHSQRWIVVGTLLAIVALGIAPPVAAAAGIFCGMRALRGHDSRGRTIIIANAVTGVLGVLFGIVVRLTF